MCDKTISRRLFMAMLAFGGVYVAGSKLKVWAGGIASVNTREDKMNGAIEIKSVDLGRPLESAVHIAHLSDAQDSRWAGVFFAPANVPFSLTGAAPNEVFVISGALVESGEQHQRGTFLVRGPSTRWEAGPDGAVLYVNRRSQEPSGRDTTITWNRLRWFQGGAEGMQVAPLPTSGHQLSLVSWMPGTHVPLHSHPRGEEIFVLSGELQDQVGRYPAGTWLRLHPNSSHAPYSEVETLILLRNGHL
jgi:quercetin dioxygenase-like cupin family protein